MTIVHSRYVEPAIVLDVDNGKRPPKPPPRTWHAINPPFQGYQPAPSEAYQQSSGDTAIVIDNGSTPRSQDYNPSLLKFFKGQVLYEPVGRSTRPLDCPSLQTSLDTGIASTTEMSHTWAMMRTQMLQREARYAMHLSQEPVLWVIGM